VNLAGRIRAERKVRQLSQEALAHQAGLSLRAYRSLEKGEAVDPHYTTLVGIARALDLPIGELLGEQVHFLGEAPEEGKERRLINLLAPTVAGAADGWEAYLEALPAQPTATAWKEERRRIAKLLDRANKMVDTLEDAGIFDVVGPYADAIIDGMAFPQPLHRNIIDLHNAIFAISLYVIPKAQNWATRSEESRQSENLDKVALEWAARGRVPAQTDG